MPRRNAYDAEPQARTDPLTGATYYVHVDESDPRERPRSGYVDPIEEGGGRAIVYREDEIADFYDVLHNRLAPSQAERRQGAPPRPERMQIAIACEEGDGPFAGFAPKLIAKLRAHIAVREIVAELGPRREMPSHDLMKSRGAFFLEESEGDEIYTMMKDPPSNAKNIEDESFDLDAGSLEALIQERLRFRARGVDGSRIAFRFFFV